MASTITVEVTELGTQDRAEPTASPPPALHRGESDLPFVPYQEGVTFQLLQVDIEAGFFVVRCAASRA